MTPKRYAPAALALLVALAGSAIVGRAVDPPSVSIAYSPDANLEIIDVALIGEARVSLDVAAYSLTDRAVVQAIAGAVDRGVRVRLLVDPSQNPRNYLIGLERAEIRVSTTRPLMHLKNFALDGRVLRTGSANFSASGLKHQRNDLVVIRDPGAAAAFGHAFADEWGRSKALPPK